MVTPVTPISGAMFQRLRVPALLYEFGIMSSISDHREIWPDFRDIKVLALCKCATTFVSLPSGQWIQCRLHLPITPCLGTVQFDLLASDRYITVNRGDWLRH